MLLCCKVPIFRMYIVVADETAPPAGLDYGTQAESTTCLVKC